MGKLVFSVLLLIFGNMAHSQGGNCLYIDATDSQLFYVKLNNKIFSSSQGGYVIIAGMQETNPELSIGFPGNQFPEQRFKLSMNNSDQGFHLKNTTEKGWELQNLKTMAVISSNNTEKIVSDPDQVKKTDAFSLMLSKVVNDSSVLFAGSRLKTPAVVQKDIAAGTSSAPIKTTDPVNVVDSTTSPVTVTSNATDSATVTKKAVKDSMEVTITQVTVQELSKEDYPDIIMIPAPVRKIFDQYFEKAYEATYVDKNKGRYDTIRLSYPINIDTPAKKSAVPAPEAPAAIAQPPVTQTPEAKTGPEKATDIINDTAMKTIEPATTKAVEIVASDTNTTTTAVVCKLMANDQDVDNLRVKIMEAASVEEKLATAKIFFISKCYAAKQIKGLSELFKGDEDKYRFFDAASPYVSDKNNFPSLISELKEDYYRNRFKAIIRK